MANMITVVIADDHVLLGQAVAAALVSREHYDVTVVTSLTELLSALERAQFDIILLDLKMPGMIGIPSVRNVVEAAGAGKVVLFTGHVDQRFVNDCITAGIKGHIPKDLPLKSLDSSLQLIDSGQIFLPVSGGIEKIETALTDRELTILRLAAAGMTNKEIARDANVSEVAIKMHMRTICRKLGARNRAHAAILGREKLLI